MFTNYSQKSSALAPKGASSAYSQKSSAYYDAREWLESFIPLVYGKEELGLERIKYFLKLLGNPENNFKSIHIAGTSGKGSTAFYCARLLRSSRFTVHGSRNLKVGLHISPHLVDIRERMQINGQLIPLAGFIRLMSRIRPIVESMKTSKVGSPSYFEILVAASFKYFAKEKVDWAIVEVGLGGRLDATNVLRPKISVITNVGLDHTDILGKTIEKISYEKAGIIKSGVPVVTGARGKALGVIEKVAREKRSKVVKIDAKVDSKYPYDTIRYNQDLSLLACKTLGISLKDDQIKRAFSAGFAGRFEEIDRGVIVDGAHNPDKVKALIRWIKASIVDKQSLRSSQAAGLSRSKIVLVIAFKKGKRWKKMVDLLLANLPIKKVIATEFQAVTDTGLFSTVSAKVVADYIKLRRKGVSLTYVYSNSQEAVFKALNLTSNSKVTNQLVLVTGSLYLVGEVRTMWKLPFI